MPTECTVKSGSSFVDKSMLTGARNAFVIHDCVMDVNRVFAKKIERSRNPLAAQKRKDQVAAVNVLLIKFYCD
jgi:hypothetical protein